MNGVCQRCSVTGRLISGRGLLLCRGCMKVVVSAGRPPPRPDDSCKHRGGVLRLEQCPSCNGTVMVKVFSCEIHKECSILPKIAGVKACRGCSDREGVSDAAVR